MSRLTNVFEINKDRFIALKECRVQCQNDGISSCHCKPNLEVWKKLAHYEDLEEQGRLIVQKHGRWICLEAEIGLYECSECGHKILRNKTNYCPNCGCKTEELPKLVELKGTEDGMD